MTELPSIIKEQEPEEILKDLIGKVTKAMPELSLVRSDPCHKLLEVCAYEMFLQQQRINYAVRQCYWQFAEQEALENLANLVGERRKLIEEATPQSPKDVFEDDEAFRRRIMTALDKFSTAGSRTGYKHVAVGSHENIKDAAVLADHEIREDSTSGLVHVYILQNRGDLNDDSPEIAAAIKALSREDTIPLTDSVAVHSASVKPYTIKATLHQTKKPLSYTAFDISTELRALAEAMRFVGRRISIGAIYKVLMRDGIDYVDLKEPTGDVIPERWEAPTCLEIEVNIV